MNVFLIVVFSLFAVFLQAAPVGNGASPALIQEGFLIPSSYWVDFRIGYEGDFVGDGRMEQIEESSGRVL